MHPLNEIRNVTRGKLLRNQTAIGLFHVSNNSMIAEACSMLPIDWLMIDLEASTATKESTLHILQALSGTKVSPFVRVPFLNKHYIEAFLDLGAHGILVPKIESREEAQEVVNAFYYPPSGNRGINPIRATGYFHNTDNYLSTANEEFLCMIQIESVKGVKNIEEIVNVPGIDVVFIGCGDLASSLGEPLNFTSQKFNDAINTVLEATLTAGKIPGIFAYNMELAKRYFYQGYRFIAIGNEIKSLTAGVTQDIHNLFK
ncbi:HpcH/HpaI aldolase family protein [Bacillus cereus]|uniref:HpcH/HpaI aldolase family protein n=1 Tax=Bacillus cereus TaxID=1396 RepID=UPI0009515520|nr:aldolase/citrate lyase family protein [Bacillus cereus]OLR26826.1 hypothetical protein BLD50_04955 [Bacillus cereus]